MAEGQLEGGSLDSPENRPSIFLQEDHFRMPSESNLPSAAPGQSHVPSLEGISARLTSPADSLIRKPPATDLPSKPSTEQIETPCDRTEQSNMEAQETSPFDDATDFRNNEPQTIASPDMAPRNEVDKDDSKYTADPCDGKLQQQISFEEPQNSHYIILDYLSFKTLSFTWADTYDTKDFGRLSTILAPALRIDYSIVASTLPKVERMPADDFLAFVSSPYFLGDPLIHTQHLLGASKFERISEDEVLGSWQIRAAHQRYDQTGRVECNGHGHAMVEHWYKKVLDGAEMVWKLAGVRPNVRWNEGNFEKIFRGPV
ncbi:uncharacterized protein KY384_007083 [Bacidia gigantensis]|uniref:uncharacterized protein n=1 Tax=Bacidia gigantensis TaxID=2732470 RepID=UPI001D044D39|nr:uncharacterized protein KY384_007083 [Bacidia gigantensis]KAG8528166.1 hypothetical protein KY384_007083 [Bacidia gigantensis]